MKRLAAGLLLVTLGWLASPAPVPLYDGVGNPDQPYRYVGRGDAPSSVTTTVTAPGGSSEAIELRSGENGPQVLVDLAAGAFTTKSSTVTLTATPLAGDGQKAPQGTLDGNVYRITAGPAAVLHPEAAQGFLFLRAAVMTSPDPVLVHRARPGDPWVEVRTTRTGRDVLSTAFRDLGDYAVVDLPGAKPLSSGGGLSASRWLLLGGGVLVLLVVTVLVLRRSGDDEQE